MIQIRVLLLGSILLLSLTIKSQQDTLVVNQDAIYDRPFISVPNTSTALGGYVEGNTNYFSEDGVSDGFSMELRRFNIFLYAPIGNRIQFLSELEFEHGTEAISLETAMIDVELNDYLNVRAGIILPTLGLVNTNHDSPNWEFVERPISSTALIPTTLSEVGFGVNGRVYPTNNSILTYDVYVVNGLQDGIILNSEGRTHLGSGKNEGRFGEDNNGIPMLNGRLALANTSGYEIGMTYYGGSYNASKIEGEEVDDKRSLNVLSPYVSAQIKKLKIQGEAVLVLVDVPEDISEIYAEKQYGGFLDLIYPVIQKRILRFDEAVLNLSARVEYADLNYGNFKTNITSSIGDENLGIAFGVGFRPRPGTIIRANYRYHWITDILGNPPAKLAGFQFGIATYF
jgi:hypothetical protein